MTRRTLLTALLALLVFAAPALAQSKEELQARFKGRDATLARLKAEGKIGEAFDGMVAATKSGVDGSVRSFVGEENADRKKLYEILAAEQTSASGGKTKVTPGMVAQVNASRSFGNAKPNDWLLVAPDTWIQKRDEARYRLVEKFKREGKVGETSSGYLDAVKADYLADNAVKRAIDEENQVRKARYEESARETKTTPDKIASARGAALISRAATGEYVKDASGWRRK